MSPTTLAFFGLIAACVTALGMIVVALISAKAGREVAQINAKATIAAAEAVAARQAVVEVKETLEADTQARKITTARQDEKLENIAATGEKTHTLVNARMGAQLKLNAIAMRRLADLTKDPADYEAARLADGELQEHESKQATVDAGKAS